MDGGWSRTCGHVQPGVDESDLDTTDTAQSILGLSGLRTLVDRRICSPFSDKEKPFMATLTLSSDLHRVFPDHLQTEYETPGQHPFARRWAMQCILQEFQSPYVLKTIADGADVISHMAVDLRKSMAECSLINSTAADVHRLFTRDTFRRFP